jgi:ATP-dependent Clp protease ATP-binding subunit ClpA
MSLGVGRLPLLPARRALTRSCGSATRQEREMFERFTDRARRVVVLAQEEARMLDHNYIGTEHILLGLIHEGEGVAAKALESLEISLEAVRQQVEEIIGHGQQAQAGHIPFTPRAKKVLELSLREAIQLGHNYIGTEHILLGLIREGEGVAAQVLVRLGADLNRVRRQVIQLLHGARGEKPPQDIAYARIPVRGSRQASIDEIRRGVEAIMNRLTLIERKLGIGPEPQPEVLHEYTRRIAKVRTDKEAAIDAMDFEQAASLRDQERRLLQERDAEQRRWQAAREQRPAEPTVPAGQPPAEATVPAEQGPAEATVPAEQPPAEATVPAEQGPAEATDPAEQGPAEATAPAEQPPAGATSAAELDQLRQQAERLLALLREHDIDPEDEAPPSADAGT